MLSNLPDVIRANILAIVLVSLHPFIGIAVVAIGEKTGNEKLFIYLGAIWIVYFLITFLNASLKIKNSRLFIGYVGIPWFALWIFCVVIYNMVIKQLIGI